jgi:GntP family gluconate:H+ symporter
LQQDDFVVTPSARREALSLSKQNIGRRVATGFGATCTKIGILIAMASIIGKCLLDSGAADRIVRSALKLLGERGAPAAFLGSGFLLGIPVFFDTVFYLMIPLGKAMRVRTGRNYLLYVLAIVAGGSMAHSLVPPTPGPLIVADQLGVGIGDMIFGGCLVGIFTAGFGYFYAHFANRMWELPLRETADLSADDLQAMIDRDESGLPPTWLSLLPILLPVVLIGSDTVLGRMNLDPESGITRWMSTLGDKNIALTLSAAIAMYLLVRTQRTNLKQLAEAVQTALAGGGVIILITAGGGAFGNVLQQTGVSELIEALPDSSPVVLLTLAFLITAAIRTAQGSATVAMITAAGIFAGIGQSGQLGFHPVYLALAIGCGSKPIAWMNDSGFWVVGRMSGMTEGETLKYVTPMTTLMGVVGLAVVLIGVTLFPLA